MIKTILSHAPKYLTGSLIASGTTLVMTKYYTTVFSPEQFGILAMYLVMFKYITTLVSLNMDSSATRFYFDYKELRRDEYLSTIFWFITFVAIIVTIISLFFMEYISSWIAPNSELIYIVTILSAIVAVYVSFLTRVLYNEHLSTSVLKQTIFQTFINHTSSVLFISILNLGILGRMGGQGLGYFLNVTTLFREFYNKKLFILKNVFNITMAKETFWLALPGVITTFQSVLFVYADRIFIKHYIGDSAVGIYTLGYMLGQGLSMVYEAISQAILPKVFNDLNTNYDKGIEELEHFSYRYYVGLIIITIIISILSPYIVAIFSNEEYSNAASVMPYVMVGFMMGGFYKIPSLVLGFHKRVWFYPFLAFFSFGINAILNWLLIPIYGIIGAAFASFIGLFIYSLVMQILSFKYLSSKYKYFSIIQYFIIFIIIFFSFL